MIPSTNKKILVAEDWKKIYQSFRNADFQSYDFETLRRTMITYLQENYPEDFNDFIDSSEYIALIDLIAFLGQNLSFRIDLNARENFIETAQRRDSILRLAQLISYNPSRNTPANGLLKITAISTTDNVFDSNGVNLSDTPIAWNDSTNPEWYQQFINILNSAMGSNFGDPSDQKTIDGILTEQYTINSSTEDVPIFNFAKSINGTSMNFEVVPCVFTNKDFIYEQSPQPGSQFSFVYKNDNQGSASASTGFFVHFRQGSIGVSNFKLDNPIPNEIVGVNINGINNDDVWLWELDKDGNYLNLWEKVQTTSGSNYNTIYNSLNKNIRKIYSVTSRDNDQIDLNFSDGVFGDLPKGEFRLFYRQSNGLTYTLKPEQLSGILILVPYTNSLGQSHTLQLTLSLQTSVDNSAPTESNINIQLKAPQSYYLQNRVITGEDYNIAPLVIGADVVKAKSVNRISSGLSRYFDISDVTGKYSSTNIFASDGMIYKDSKEEYFEFEFFNKNQLLGIFKNKLEPIVASTAIRSFYFDNYPKIDTTDQTILWNEINKTPGQSRGYFYNSQNIFSVGEYVNNDLRFLTQGSLVKFIPPTGKYFDSKNNLKTIPTSGIPSSGKTYIWSGVFQVIGDGSNGGTGVLSDGTGPIILTNRIPSGAVIAEIIPKYQSLLTFAIENEMANICLSQQNFGLTINNLTRKWDIIFNSNLDITSSFSLNNQSNNDSLGLDASWIILFVWDGKKYKVRYRILNYVFESDNETSFYIDENSVNYDFYTNTIIKDKIDVLSVNPKSTSTVALGTNYQWQIDGSIVETDGYIRPNKIKVSFYDFNNSGQINDPDSFDNIVDPFSINGDTGYRDKFLYFKKTSDGTDYKLTADEIIAYPNEEVFFVENFDISLIENNSLYYFYDSNIDIVKYWSTLTNSLVVTDQYFGKVGRSNLKFQYLHNTTSQRRIDPSKSNIIDIYVLSLSYDQEFRNWLSGTVTTEPLTPTSQTLNQKYKSKLDNIKSISDEVIFHPVKYKVLFGNKANVNLQATFKAVKNSTVLTSNTDLRAKILTAINDFFALENWNFGQSFYFSELSAYVMNLLTPDITNFVIVPTNGSTFGSLYEISCQENEIFINGTNIDNIEIIDAITASQLNLTTSIITSTGT
jgi:hypothetical protein